MAKTRVKTQITAQAQTMVKKPTIIFMFGGSGDLAYRKLMPALYNLYLDNYLPEKYHIVGLGRTEYNNTSYRNYIKKGIEQHSRRKDTTEWKDFSSNLEYQVADLEDQNAY